MKNYIEECLEADAVCVIMRHNDEMCPIVYWNGPNQTNPSIRTYYRGNVDGRWDGPLCETASEVLHQLASSNLAKCSVPVQLAIDLFQLDLPFAAPAGRPVNVLDHKSVDKEEEVFESGGVK